MYDFSGADGDGGGEEFGEEGAEVLEPIRTDADDQVAEPEFVQGVLEFEVAINGKEDVKVALGEAKERPVFRAAPSGLGNCLYRMAWKGGANSGMDTLV